MNILKEITSSLQTNNRVFERPMRFDVDKLSKLKAPKLRSLLTDLDAFCDEILLRNQNIHSQNQVLQESIENFKEKYIHIVKMNSQLGETVNRHALQESSASLVCESLLRIFETSGADLAQVRQYLKGKSKPGEAPPKDDTEQPKEVCDLEKAAQAIRKLTLAVDKLYLSKC